MNELRAIDVFVKAAELGSLRRAAAAQGVTPQAASQALGQLEAHLGVRLFHRTTRSLALTEDGQQFLATARPGLDLLQRAVQDARRGRAEMAGPLRIAAPRAVAQEVVWPVVDAFCRRYPEAAPDVLVDDRVGNWVEDRIDVGFRIGGTPEDGLIARRLLPLQLLVCAAPAYVERHGAPDGIAALAQHRCSGFRHPATGRLMPWELQVGDTLVTQPLPAVLSSNDIAFEAAAVLAGHAIGQLLGTTAAPWVRAGKLVVVLPQHAAHHLGLYVYYGSRSAQPARVRAFVDLAVEMLADNSAYFLTADELRA